MSNNDYVDVIEGKYESEFEVDTTQSPPVVEEYEIAETTLSKMVLNDQKIQAIEERRDFICKSANIWAEKEIKRIKSYNEWISQPLKYFMIGINRNNPKLKSLKFPMGKIGLRQSPQKIEIDADFVPAEHKDDPNVVRKVSYAVSKKDIASQLKETGELPDYASVVPGETKFYYKGE